jgi:hypothetical protein
MGGLGDTISAIAGGGIFSKKLRKKSGEFLFGKKDKTKQLSTLTPEQQELMSLINEGLTSGQGPFADIFGGFNQDQFDKGVAQPAMKNFQDNILPQIQEKFISNNQALGGGMQRAQMKAGTDLQSQLAGLMYQAQQDAGKNKMSGINTPLGTKTFDNIIKKGTTGVIPSLLQGGGQGLGNIASSAIAG